MSDMGGGSSRSIAVSTASNIPGVWIGSKAAVIWPLSRNIGLEIKVVKADSKCTARGYAAKNISIACLRSSPIAPPRFAELISGVLNAFAGTVF